MSLKDYIGLKIKNGRLEKGLTQEQLAAEIGKAVETISNIERGRNHTSLETLEKISDVLDIPVARLFKDADKASGISRRRMEKLEDFEKLLMELDDKELTFLYELTISLLKHSRS